MCIRDSASALPYSPDRLLDGRGRQRRVVHPQAVPILAGSGKDAAHRDLYAAVAQGLVQEMCIRDRSQSESQFVVNSPLVALADGEIAVDRAFQSIKKAAKARPGKVFNLVQQIFYRLRCTKN